MRDEFLEPILASDREVADEVGLRPRLLDDFVGQRELKEHLDIVLGAAKQRGQAADHILLAGPPGLGKTTMACIVAAAMEDFQIDIVVGKGPAASSIRLTLPRFTLIGATTRTGMITGPLRDRFGLVARLDYYDAAELDAIVQRTSRILDVPLSDDASLHIARRSRGTPRIANRLLRRVRDFAEVRGDGTINSTTALEALRVFGVDELGLDKVDRAILRSLCEQFDGGPVGLTTLAIAVGEQPETVEDVYEPFLIQQGLIARTPRGRVAMDAARSHLANP